jgi:hypothetical protein
MLANAVWWHRLHSTWLTCQIHTVYVANSSRVGMCNSFNIQKWELRFKILSSEKKIKHTNTQNMLEKHKTNLRIPRTNKLDSKWEFRNPLHGSILHLSHWNVVTLDICISRNITSKTNMHYSFKKTLLAYQLLRVTNLLHLIQKGGVIASFYIQRISLTFSRFVYDKQYTLGSFVEIVSTYPNLNHLSIITEINIWTTVVYSHNFNFQY